MWRLFYACSAILVLVLIPKAPARGAEATTGAITGVVLTKGAPIAQAHVNASSPSGTYAAFTNVRGHFTMLGITPDSYTVSVQAAGYAPASQSGVTVLPNQTQQLAFHLVAELKTIASARARARAFTSGNTGDVFTVPARRAGAPPVSASGLANYSAGTVQGAIAAVPGVTFDPFANAILRGGKVDDAVFDFDSVPVPQGLIGEPGGNVVGAQLPVTGIASTTVTLAGYQTQGDNALGGVVDEIPAVGTYPGTTTLDVSEGTGGHLQLANLQVLGATPDQRWRYALAATAGSESFAYGDGHTFYPAEAATYGLGLESRSQFAIESNVHFRWTPKDDLSLLGFTGDASYNEYGTPYAGETFGAFDGATIKYPGEANPGAPVTFPAGIRGSFGIFKAAWLHTGSHTLSRVQAYDSQFGASAGGPYWDENGFPNGTFSFSGRQSGREQAIVFDGDDFLGDRHHLRYGVEYRITHYVLDQVVPTFDEIVRSNPMLHSYLAYAGDTWHAGDKLDLMGALRLTGTRIAPSTGYAYSVGALDPHFSAVYRIGSMYALRGTFDHTTVAPKPLEADRYDSNNVDQNGNPAPFVTLVPETANVYTASLEGTGKTQFRFTYWAELENNRIDVLPYNYRQAGGELAPSPVGVPANVGQLRAHGLEVWLSRAALTFNAEYIRASSSSASEFAFNNLNAPAIAAGHLFPIGYVPDLTATLSYELRAAAGRVRIEPSLSYESGYPYGVGKEAWIFDPVTKQPVQVPNDNHVNPGASYYFLQDPSLPYNAQSNPYIGTMGTPEGNDPNTLRSPPQTLVNLRVEGDVTPRLSAILDVVNLLGTSTPTAYGANGYLIGPPGYAGGNPLYAVYYQGVMGSPQPYLLGNGVPTNDGVRQSVPWTYGRAGYVPYSYPMARSVQLRLLWRL